jgi:hypothetical protein
MKVTTESKQKPTQNDIPPKVGAPHGNRNRAKDPDVVRDRISARVPVELIEKLTATAKKEKKTFSAKVEEILLAYYK